MSERSYDLAIIGGGINGCGIARDAAGRGLKVLLVEQDDIASATSSWSSKLIHGGLRYLEQYEFRLVREALQEREVLLKIAPHIIQPLEFILPHDEHMRPAWMIRMGLFMYDHIGGKISLPGSRSVRFPDDIYSAGLNRNFRRGFFYSDAKVDDARLTLFNAVSARDLGAAIRTRTRLLAGARQDGAWQLTLEDQNSKATTTVHARALVNAAGPWVKQLLSDRLKVITKSSAKLVKGSHIVVPRVHHQQHAYILQNTDKRVVFVIPYEDQFSLIGTTDVEIHDLGDAAAITAQETTYLVNAVNRYLAKPITAQDVVWSYAGVRPLYDDGEDNPSEITRDYMLKVDDDNGAAPVLSIFGGKITTYRRLAEHALGELALYFPQMTAPWTASKPLPGGDIESVASEAMRLGATRSGLPQDYLQRLVARHGSRATEVLGDAKKLSDLGAAFGHGAHMLCEREIDFFMRHEWAQTSEDILWRRTKCGLHMDVKERARAANFINAGAFAR
jgi:glycerol-3-phosphate dehydrogenase